MQEVGIEEICISSITVAELEYGIAKSFKREENRIALLEFLILFTILSFDQNDATKYGQLRYNLQKSRHTYWEYGFAYRIPGFGKRYDSDYK